jgi:pyruvate,orthophosphate dikinase
MTALNATALTVTTILPAGAQTVATFTRNPSTGARELYGEFLINAQGEDVVAGIRTPQPLTEAARKEAGETAPSLEAAMPDTYRQLAAVFEKLEKHYRDMQDIEFTIQEGKLWMLQTRSGKRTAKAALKVAVDLVAEGLIAPEEAVMRIDAAGLDQLLHPTIDPAAERHLVVTGLPASPGAASGEIVFDADEAEALKGHGREVILVRTETSPEDIHGMHAAAGILTTRGGMTSHAAVVARGMGRPCVCGAGSLRIDAKAGTITFDAWIGTCGFYGCPSPSEIRAFHPSEGGNVYDRNARLVGHLENIRRVNVSIVSVPKYVRDAFVATDSDGLVMEWNRAAESLLTHGAQLTALAELQDRVAELEGGS